MIFFVDLVGNLLERGVANCHANCQLFSQLFYLKLIDFITVSLFICLFCVSDILFFGLGIFNTPALAHLYFAG